MEQTGSGGLAAVDTATTSIEKALDVLFHLHAAAEPAGVTAIGRALGIPKSSTHRLLAALAARGLVERDARGRYLPGMALVALGVGMLDREPLVAAARPLLEAESAELGDTVFLMAARAGRIRVLDKVEGTGFLRAAPRIGEEIPVHATAVGRLYLALDAAQLEFDDSNLEQFTDKTPRAGGSLDRRIRLAGRRGWDVNEAEWIEGLTVIAVPVLVDDKLIGAIAVAAAQGAASVADPSASAAHLLDAARRIAARMQGEIQ